MAEPILTWAGGKRQLLDSILPRLPPKDEFGTYYEPFFGGGAVFFALEPVNGQLNDLNARLINFYRHARDNPEQIIGENKEIDSEFEDRSEDDRKEFYYDLREEFNSLRDEDGDCEDEFLEASLFLFLNRTCFNGLFRTNQKGEFNVPIGSGWTRTAAIEHRIRQGYRVLQGSTLTSKDFTYVRDEAVNNDLVFFDPPYPKQSKTAKFNKYNPDGFNRERQEELRELALELDEIGAHVVITNAASAADLYTDHTNFNERFRVVPVEGKRRINSDHTKRSDIGNTDIIVTNFSPFSEQMTLDEFRQKGGIESIE